MRRWLMLASLLRVACTVFLPVNPNPTKRGRISALGANVKEVGQDLSGAAVHAEALTASVSGWSGPRTWVRASRGLRDVREIVASNAHVVKVRHGSDERATGGTYGHTDRTAQ